MKTYGDLVRSQTSATTYLRGLGRDAMIDKLPRVPDFTGHDLAKVLFAFGAELEKTKGFLTAELLASALAATRKEIGEYPTPITIEQAITFRDNPNVRPLRFTPETLESLRAKSAFYLLAKCLGHWE